MKKGLLYHCLVLSVIFHLALFAFIRLDQSGNKKEKEPIAIDLVGPLNVGPKTVLPQQEQKQARPVGKAPKTAQTVPAPPIRPSMPAPASPAAPPPAPAIGEMLKNLARASAPMPAPGDIRAPEPSKGGPRGAAPGARQPAAPSAPSAAPPGAEGPRKLIRPTEEDLQRYAKVDRETEKSKDDEVTLDTDDLMYTAYLQGLKRRIETIWKYPETARRDAEQGDLQMKFTIAKSGKVENIELIKSSGYQILDDAAKQALIDASPFNPLPGNWKKDSFTITGTFIYRLYGLYLE